MDGKTRRSLVNFCKIVLATIFIFFLFFLIVGISILLTEPLDKTDYEQLYNEEKMNVTNFNNGYQTALIHLGQCRTFQNVAIGINPQTNQTQGVQLLVGAHCIGGDGR